MPEMFAKHACKIAAIALLCLMILAVPLAKADETTESFTVYTDKGEYMVGEIVRIYIEAKAIDPDQTITVHKIVVYDPTNSTVAEWDNLEIVLTETEIPVYVNSIVAEMEGSYSVYAEATGCPWILRAFWWFFCYRFWKPKTVPEVPYGTVIALTTLAAATGLYIKKKKF